MGERASTAALSLALERYEVTEDGRVFSLTNWRGQGRTEVRQEPNYHGYPSVRIMIGDERKRITTHRLVAQAFLPPRPSPLHQIRHLDGDKSNSHAHNLAWGTAKDNADDRQQHGRTSHGEAHSDATRRGNLRVARAKKRKFGFTDGPWSVRETQTKISVRRSGIPICTLALASTPLQAEERRANARLISAAPDMFEALWQCIGSLKALGAQDGYASTAAKAAIAKAEGLPNLADAHKNPLPGEIAP